MDDEVVKALALPTLPNLKEIQNPCLNKYGTSKNTKKAYKGHLSWGNKFLEKMVAQRRVSGEDGNQIDVDKLVKAFGNPPNEYSAMALPHTQVLQ